MPQNIQLIETHRPDLVAVCGVDHIDRMDVAQRLAEHQLRGADVSIATLPVPLAQCWRRWATCVFSADVLLHVLRHARDNGESDFRNTSCRVWGVTTRYCAVPFASTKTRGSNTASSWKTRWSDAAPASRALGPPQACRLPLL